MKKETGLKKRRKYEDSFKAEVLKMISDGRPVNEVSQTLGIGENLIYKWRRRQNTQLKEIFNHQSPGAPDLLIENEQLKSRFTEN